MADARQQIHDCLLSYCRGIDRLDAATIEQAFHPGAILAGYGGDPMPIEEFAPYAVAALAKRYRATQHRISNTAIAFDADSGAAKVETYVTAYHVRPTDGPDELQTFVGRYIDRFERRDDVWRITSRTLRMDFSRTESIAAPMPGHWIPSGRGGTPDPLD